MVIAEKLKFVSGYNPVPALICFSHLRWEFVFQRPQHLMRRFAETRRVLFWEEPVYHDGPFEPRLSRRACPHSGVTVLTPELEHGLGKAEDGQLMRLLDEELAHTDKIIRWYYTPMMLPFSDHVVAECVVYDCMDELSAFKYAPPELLDREQSLIAQADVIFTGGSSLYEAKRARHPNVHAFPSSVDASHFERAREATAAPIDQAAISRPRLGFVGVIDERMDLEMLAAIATARPDWSLVMIGPVVKVGEQELPRRGNIHYLGPKSYASLPDYLAGWDVALMPFAINDSTRFISPTKTPEYLAAGCPVVSTPIADVVLHYGQLDGVLIADGAEAFISSCEQALTLNSARTEWRDEADAQLALGSWDVTAAQMASLVDAAIKRRKLNSTETAAAKTKSRSQTTPEHYDVMVVGAGFAGAVMAERLASDGGKRVLVVDRRPHIGGNAFDQVDEAGILVHRYGPHIFHTNSPEIVAYLSRFTEWRTYEHRVLADINGQLVPIPINRTTLNVLYELDLQTDAEAEAFLAARAEPVDPIRTSADVVVSKVGSELYKTFFRGYTRKQWGMDPSDLDKSVTARVPTRTDTDDRYFSDRFQAMPLEGYTRMFERMLNHPNIDLLPGTDYADARARYGHDHLVFTGPIDEYFGHRYGKLPYRSLNFEHRTLQQVWSQPVAVINYPGEEVPYTRITEYKHLTGQQSSRTSITVEYPSDIGDPYYPIPRDENQALFKRYEALALAESNVSFVGRLATYRYYNMDQVVGQALATYRRLASALASHPAARTAVPVSGAT